MVDLEALGDYVREAREAKGMLQSDLGRRLGKSRAWVSLFERGHILNPKVTFLETIAEILEVPPQAIFQRAGISLPDVETGQVQWLVEELDLPNRRRLILIGHALLQEQKNRPEKGDQSAARPSPRK